MGFMASSPPQRNTVDAITTWIMSAAVVAGLSGFALVIAGGFMTASAVREGIQQVPVESPAPIEAPLIP